MEESALALILEKCLDLIDEGGEPEDIAEHYPALKEHILPLLQVAAAIRDGIEDIDLALDLPLEFLDALGERLHLPG
ncbi:MAG: hypothetical protein Q7T33_13285 [Dehalococcoidia bacterium]|nr:hypothetical protein [Dehalococcoidia bacterium]